MLALKDARKILLAQAKKHREINRLSIETIALECAQGRVLAEDCISSLNVPPADNSAMDGYAVKSNDALKGTTLIISQYIAAGDIPQPLKPNTCARILTGAEIPAGANAVIMQENCTLVDNSITLNTKTENANNVREKGQDILSGSLVLEKGLSLRPQDLGLLASINKPSITVYKPIRAVLLSTGNELVLPGHALKPGKIYNSNRYLLVGLLEKLGIEVVEESIIADTLEATRKALAHAAEISDVIISTGGVSVGDADFVKPAVNELGALDLWKVAMKPGKPLAFGHVANTPFVGLPGNPVSAFVTFVLLIRPYLQQLQGQAPEAIKKIKIPANFSKKTAGMRDEFMRGKLSEAGVSLYPQQSSGALSSVVWADCLVWIIAGETVQHGQLVNVILL